MKLEPGTSPAPRLIFYASNVSRDHSQKKVMAQTFPSKCLNLRLESVETVSLDSEEEEGGDPDICDIKKA